VTLIIAFCIGFFAGLRSLTAPAATAWAVHLGWLKPDGPLALIGSLPAVVILTVLAIGELVADKLPWTPSRTAPLGLIARIAMGGLTGACIVAAGGQRMFLGVLLGAIGGVAGCFAGYYTRRRLVKALRTRDIYIALIEDVVAIVGSFWAVSRF
jgi:uncharacterized membrane protein